MSVMINEQRNQSCQGSKPSEVATINTNWRYPGQIWLGDEFEIQQIGFEEDERKRPYVLKMQPTKQAATSTRLAVFQAKHAPFLADPWTENMIRIPQKFAQQLNDWYKRQLLSPGMPLAITATLIKGGGRVNPNRQVFVPPYIEEPLNLPVKLTTVPKGQTIPVWNKIEISHVKANMQTRMRKNSPSERKATVAKFLLFKTTNAAYSGPGPYAARIIARRFDLEVNDKAGIANIVFEVSVLNRKMEKDREPQEPIFKNDLFKNDNDDSYRKSPIKPNQQRLSVIFF